MLRGLLIVSGLLGLLSVGLGRPSTSSAEATWAFMQQYIGTWSGEVILEDQTGTVLKRFPTAAEYWRSGDRIRALTAFDLESGMAVTESESYIRNKLLFSEVTQDGKKTLYRGYLRDDELFWIPYDAALVTERKMKEWFSEDEGEPVLHMKGVELLRSEGKKAAVVLSVTLRKK